jgi:methyltransferase (TIGR00027 family)
LSGAAAKTAIMPIALVAAEQYFPPPQRIVDDPLALEMLPWGARLFVRCLQPRFIREWMISASEKSNPGLWGGLLCRKRYIDEALRASAREVETVVNLGAGLDSRCFRLPGLSTVPVWEVDQRRNIDLKAARLRRVLGAVPANVRLVPVDFEEESLGEGLSRQGFSVGRRTFFVWEAVTQYLTEAGVRAVFAFLSAAAQGSRLAFTYVRREFLQGTELFGWPSGYRRFVASGLWRFGMTPQSCSDLLAGYGWRIIEDVAYAEVASRYFAPAGRALTATQVERVVLAQRI